jgi:type I restriction-modification system DNA methylase subunit
MKEQAKQKFGELVERFRYNLDVYKKSTYNETQVRREFIDPFFEALGWDVSNKQGYAEQYKEVVHEDAIKVGRSTRAPDYSFRIGGQRKFFVEAKKPAVNIKEDVSPSYQLRRYAWSAKLPLSVVTDFEEFSVFDCQIKPNPTDKTGVGRIAYYTFEDYLDKFDEIYDVFSKEAVLKGSFDRYAQSTKGKKGTTEVDNEFLKEIESWRELLAKNIALRNPAVSIYELNYAVQKLLDRIIFLRICEDRGIEPYGQLQTKAESGDVYTHLMNHFKLAESKYNSGIFDFNADKITPTLSIDDRVLKTIIQSLYYPKSPYEFSVLGVEILGNVYEQFLGKVIRLTAGHQAKVETKPEVKKAGGVYYTPQYIVDYIVTNTVGKLVEGKTPEEIAEMKILDPACGSGSFLIGAYTYLLRYHLDWYTNNKPKKHKEAVFQVRENEWYLTTVEKKRILLNNIFGVDIDPQAVEVTKLSLLLKVLEHESRESIDQQVKIGLEGVLPNLVDNIKCGNSLIGTDFYGTGQQETLFDEAEMRRINVFDWNDERKGFGGIMKRGGFDCVIGNPPWGADFGKEERSYLVNRYPLVPTKTKDSYSYFLFQAIDLVCDTGFLGFIVPNTWLLINSAKELRHELLSLNIKEIVDHGDGVFKQATVESATLLLVKSKDVDGKCRAVRFRKGTKVVDHLVDKLIWLEDEYCRIIIEMDKSAQELLKKLRSKSEPFEKRCTIIWGIKPYQVGHGIPPQTREMLEKRVYHSTTKRGEDWKPFLVGSNVNRYRLHFPGNQFIKYGKWLMYPSNETLILQPKILMRQTSDSIRACYDEDCYYCQNSVFIIHASEINQKFLLGLLNSKLLNFVYKLGNPQTSKVFAEIKPRVIKQLPIRTIDFSNSAEKAQHDKLVALVDSMLELQKKYHETRMERDKELYERQIKIADVQIDRLVYDLYGLTEEEIGVVEGSEQG